MTGWTQSGSVSAIADDGTFNTGCKPRVSDRAFFGGPGSGGSYASLTQKIDLLGGVQNFAAVELDSGTLTAEIKILLSNLFCVVPSL